MPPFSRLISEHALFTPVSSLLTSSKGFRDASVSVRWNHTKMQPPFDILRRVNCVVCVCAQYTAERRLSESQSPESALVKEKFTMYSPITATKRRSHMFQIKIQY